MSARSSWLRRLGLALLWWLAAALVVVAAAALVAGLGLAWLAVSGSEIGELQRALWLGLARSVAGTALAPLGALTVLVWLGLSARWPALEASWPRLLAGVPALAAAAFLPVGGFLFTAWRPETAADRIGTLLWVSGAVSAALLLGRRAVPALKPGALAPREPRGGPGAA